MIGWKFRITTTQSADPVEVKITPKAAMAFERHFKTGLIKAFSVEQRVEHSYWLAWKSMQFAGHVVKPFDDWVDELDNVEMVAPDPLPETGTSS